MRTIGLGVVMHVLRVIFGNAFALQYVITPTTDKILLVPMTYAAVTGSVVYIAGSVPLHICCSYIIWDTTLMTWLPMWFSHFLLIVVYPAFLAVFAKLQYRT